ncbi:MAG: NUDIX domain-containing protein [Planctomycetota bacterium]
MNDAQQHVTPRNHGVRRGVIGILSRGDEYLMIRRADGVAKPGCWCFPGGHVEPGETPRQAVGRELYEELGIHVRPTERLGSVRVMDSRHILVAWRVEHVEGDFQIAQKEIAEIRWVAGDQIRDIHPGLPSNESVLEMLRI